jgi:hypothetical protein
MLGWGDSALLKCTCWNFGGGGGTLVSILVGDASVAPMGSGLELRGKNCFSNMFSPDMLGGPVRGAGSMEELGFGRLPAPIS